MKFGVGELEERNYVRASIVQPLKINHQHSPSLLDGGSLHMHKNFKELLQILVGNA